MPGKPLVLDASTAILLAKIGVLRDVAGRGRAFIPPSALREATVKDTPDAQVIRALVEEGLIRSCPAKGGTERIRKDFRLDEGESESIALAREMGGICGTDDGPAIRCCKVLGIPFTSAVALLVAMAEGKALAGELALELMAKLERFGRYDPRILEDAARRLRSVGGGPGKEA
jgi:predicted nucleic acid-binding protein